MNSKTLSMIRNFFPTILEIINFLKNLTSSNQTHKEKSPL